MQGSRSPKYIWHQIPLFRLIWSFIGGIIIGIFWARLDFAWWSLSLAALLFIILLLFSKFLIARMMIIPMFILLGYSIVVVNTDRLFPNHISNFGLEEQTIIGVLSSDAIPRAKSIKTEVNVIGLASGEQSSKMHGKILVYFEKDSFAAKLGLNDTVLLNGWFNEVSPPQNPSEFNYKRYLGFHQITHQLYVKSSQWSLLSKGTGFLRWIKDLQHKVLSILSDKGLESGELAIVSALLVGYKHYLTLDQVNAFASAGAMHVLAVSGLHVGIIYLVLSRFLRPIERLRNGKYIAGILALFALWLYAGVTGFSPSVTRATTMFSFVIGARLLKRNTDIFNTLATSAMLLLIINPFLIVEVGFQLSYLAVIGIVVLQPRIYDLWQPKYWLLDKIWAITAVSIAAQTATFPLGLLYFHQFPTYFLLSNLIVIPAATVILPIGIALISTSWIPYVSDVLATVLRFIVHILDLVIAQLQYLPGALISSIDISIFETYFIYMVIITSVGFLIRRRAIWLWSFLACLCIIEGLNIRETLIQKQQIQIVFYSVRGHDAIDWIDGVHHTFYSDSVLASDFDKMRFHIHHYWWSLDLDLPEMHEFEQGYFVFDDLKVLILTDNLVKLDSDQAVDLLYVSERTSLHPKDVIKQVNPEMVVLSPNVDWKSRRYWVSLLSDNAVDYHDMKADGAYVIDLQSI